MFIVLIYLILTVYTNHSESKKTHYFVHLMKTRKFQKWRRGCEPPFRSFNLIVICRPFPLQGRYFRNPAFHPWELIMVVAMSNFYLKDTNLLLSELWAGLCCIVWPCKYPWCVTPFVKLPATGMWWPCGINGGWMPSNPPAKFGDLALWGAEGLIACSSLYLGCITWPLWNWGWPDWVLIWGGWACCSGGCCFRGCSGCCL